MGFEFDNLYNEEPFEIEFLPRDDIQKGAGIQLVLNRDVISLDFLENAKGTLTDILSIAENETKAVDARENLGVQLQVVTRLTDEIRQYARVLGGRPGESTPKDRVIVSWNLVRNGVPVPVSYEELASWKLSMLKRLFEFCVFEAQAVEKKPVKRSGKRS